MLTITGLTLAVSTTCRQITSAAIEEPPGVSTRSTTALISGLSRALSSDSAMV